MGHTEQGQPDGPQGRRIEAGPWERAGAWAATGRGAATANVLVAALLAAGCLVAYVAFWLEDRANPPTCHGIGWGCSPNPATSLFLVAAFVVVPALAVSTVLIRVGRSVASRASGGWRHVGTAMVLLPVAAHAAALVLLMAVVAGSLPGWMAYVG